MRSVEQQQQHKNMLGHRIADGRLELVSVLGLGAYGVVYLARDLLHPLHQEPYASTSNQDLPRALASSHGGAASGYYAVKCLNKVGLDSRQRHFQRREITLHTMASRCESVVTLHRVIDDPADPNVYVVMDYCPDGDLFSMITERQRYVVSPPSPLRDPVTGNKVAVDVDHDDRYQRSRAAMDELVKRVFLQIVDAVDFCHGYGIFHRDLKPENILCLQGGARVVLADFGLATGEKTSCDFGCGSTFYMGPECQGGITSRLARYSTAANDVWSLGVILVNLICGRNPWKQACPNDETFVEYLRNPDFLKEILPISEETNAVLKRIFTVREDWRCSLPELRKMVLAIPRLTATEAEVRRRQEQARKEHARLRSLRREEEKRRLAIKEEQAKVVADVASPPTVPAAAATRVSARCARLRPEDVKTPISPQPGPTPAATPKLADVAFFSELPSSAGAVQDHDSVYDGTQEYSVDACEADVLPSAACQVDNAVAPPTPDGEVDWKRHPISAHGPVRPQAPATLTPPKATFKADVGAGSATSPSSPTGSDFSTPASTGDSEMTMESASGQSYESGRSSASYTGLPPTPRFSPGGIGRPLHHGGHVNFDSGFDSLSIRSPRNGHEDHAVESAHPFHSVKKGWKTPLPFPDQRALDEPCSPTTASRPSFRRAAKELLGKRLSISRRDHSPMSIDEDTAKGVTPSGLAIWKASDQRGATAELSPVPCENEALLHTGVDVLPRFGGTLPKRNAARQAAPSVSSDVALPADSRHARGLFAPVAYPRA